LGRKRSHDRREARRATEILKRHFVRTQATLKAQCPACGRGLEIAVPALPKRGVKLRVSEACSCGNVVTVVLTGQDLAPSPGAPVGSEP
jgi:transcription elongation factor Elf1